MAVAACPGCLAVPPPRAVLAQDTPAQLVLSVPDVHCATCIGTVESTLASQPGVASARVNLSLKRVMVHGAPDLSAAALIAALHRAGVPAHLMDASQLAPRGDPVGQALLVRLAVAGFAMMNVMLFSVAIWSGASQATQHLFHLISAAITLPAVLFCGQPFFVSAMGALRARRLNMDVPIALAILLASGMSFFEVLVGGPQAYFDAALALTFFLLIGRYLDHRTRTAARSAARDLAALEVHRAVRMKGGIAAEVPVANLAVGDTVLIPTGMRVPVDGILRSGSARTDRSFLTGESVAVEQVSGDPVQAGEINLGPAIEIEATAVGADTTLRRIAAMVEMAEMSRNSYTNLADRAARVYAPAVHLLAFGAFAAWVGLTGDVRLALNIAVAVLIITCPCALGLAVPAVATAAIARLYDLGFLVKSGTALERLAEVDLAIFDKTGTLTMPQANGCDAKLSAQDIAVARALAQISDHPVARSILAALVARAPDIAPAPLRQIEEIAGCGIRAIWRDLPVRLGKGAWIGADFAGTGLKIGDGTPVALTLAEELRPGVRPALDGLRAAGLGTRILSGDSPAAVAAIADQLGVDQAAAGVSATEKYDHLRALAAADQRVLMVGDGLNDAACLAAAHASLAPATALEAARTAADIVLLRDTLADLPLLIAIARATTRLSKQNFAIAAGYNAVAVPVALMGYASPLLAALAMSASSITVLVNAMRVRGVR